MTLLDASARPIMPEMGPVRLAPPADDAPRDTEPTPAAPPEPPRDLGPVLRAMTDFTKARTSGMDPLPYLRDALREFAAVAQYAVALDVDYAIVSTETSIEVKDLTPNGEAFLGAWSEMISTLETQSDKVKLQRLEMTVGYLSNTVAQLQRQLDNQAIDIQKLLKKIRS